MIATPKIHFKLIPRNDRRIIYETYCGNYVPTTGTISVGQFHLSDLRPIFFCRECVQILRTKQPDLFLGKGKEWKE